MPKLVDHESRRETITAAVRRLVSTQGLDGVTVARTAAEAGMSVGQLQHYFDSKDELLAETYRRVIARLFRRVADATAASVAEHLSIRTVVTQSLGELLPLDDERAGDLQVTLAFLGRTLAHPELGDRYARTVADIRSRLTTAVHNGKECGEVPADTDEDQAALRLLSLTQGLALQLLSGGDAVSAPDATEVLRAEIERVFNGECRQWQS